MGYENLDKDGFLPAKLKSANFSNFSKFRTSIFNSKSRKGYTKVLLKREIRLLVKDKRETTLSDYFALNSEQQVK